VATEIRQKKISKSSTMQNSPELLTDSYDYSLPKELVATEPATPPDSARLLVYDRIEGRVIHSRFSEILDFLPKDCAVFLNDTKVIKARLYGKKESGGRIEMLFERPLANGDFRTIIRGRVKEGSKIHFKDGLVAQVLSLEADGSRRVVFEKDGRRVDFETLVDILEKIGHVPLPPYMRREDRGEDEEHYQSIFAKKVGAVAAPTASLHFTKELLQRLKERHDTYTLTLHVGSGTFKPVESEKIIDHPMHSEFFHIPREAAAVIDSKRDILAVGTTVTRTIEYYIRTGRREGECDIFIHPHNPPSRVNYLLTNFHLPKSTLIMLVSAFIGRQKTLELYREAIEKRYRFYSYGDAMLIL